MYEFADIGLTSDQLVDVHNCLQSEVRADLLFSMLFNADDSIEGSFCVLDENGEFKEIGKISGFSFSYSEDKKEEIDLKVSYNNSVFFDESKELTKEEWNKIIKHIKDKYR
jgi:hypothetical protein